MPYNTFVDLRNLPSLQEVAAPEVIAIPAV
jgi:hypothetical protein